MKTIYKYTLEIKDKQILSIPKIGEYLDFQNQDGKIVFWMEVETDELLMSDEVFFIVGTGNPIPEEATHYQSSVQVGIFVWHIYQSLY